MAGFQTRRKKICSAVTAALLILPCAASAQDDEDGLQLEEVIVTAQRREQSLQEVPLSIETFSGETIDMQGYRNLDDLAQYSPSVSIGDGTSVQDQQIRIRGFGTTGNSLTLEQAVPIFVDNIHFGRQSMIKTAFLDVESVEVLKGPQPVFFGMNATAGAFNIQTRRPTEEWEGTVIAEVGNSNHQKFSLGVGGPISDTLGIRVAGINESNDGHIRNAITGKKMPHYDHKGGRVTLEWTPNDKLVTTFKVEGSRLRNGADANVLCLTGDPLIYPRDSPAQRPGSIDGVPITDEGNPRSVWGDPPLGEGWSTPFAALDRYPNCFDSNIGTGSEAGYWPIPLYISEDNSYTGALDIREAAQAFSTGSMIPGRPEDGGAIDMGGIAGHDNVDTEQAYLNLSYSMDNGVEVDWTSALVSFYRDPVRDNSNSPFLVNYQGRIEDFGQWSSELRFTSAPEAHTLGNGNIEWMAGLFYQATTKDHYSSSLRANIRRGQRFNWLTEDADWTSAFGTMTYNFMEDRASIDIGGRMARISKDVFIAGYGAQWIFDVMPCAPSVNDDTGGGNTDPATCEMHPDAYQVDPATARILVPGADMNNLWALHYNESRYTPSNWRSPLASAVGLTAPDMSVREGPHADQFTVNEFDPQIALRYRLGDNHSLFFRWAQSFKAAGYDTGQTSIPETIEDMKFDSEQGETFEIGSKGMLWDGRARYDVTLFQTVFDDLQLSGAAPTTSDQDSVSLNAGEQKVTGIEFGLSAAVSERLILGLQGAIMDSELDDFTGVGCTYAEFVNTRDNLNIPGIWPCTDLENETTDYSGRQPEGTEDWKFVVTVDYDQPIIGNLNMFFNGQGYVSSGGPLYLVSYDTHGNMNLTLGIGDQEGTWTFAAYGHNLLEPRPEYHRELDVPGSRTGLITMGGEATGSEGFASWGVRFQYFFN